MHPIKILEAEHKEILKNIDVLENSLEKIKDSKNFAEIKKEVPKLEKVSHILEAAELHHKREEDVLFPLLEKGGIDGPPAVMRMEHEELRKRKKGFVQALKNIKKLKFEKFADDIEENGEYIVSVLRHHIDKENNILYPIAMQTIVNEEWDNVRKKFDKIGYCCFSPKAVKK